MSVGVDYQGDIRNVKIFVASSTELRAERDELINICNRVNKYYQHLKIEPIEWEIDIPSGSYGKRVQYEINPKLMKSDIVIVLFHSKVGSFTREEYDLSVANNKKVFIYFKQGFKPQTDLEQRGYEEVIRLQKQLQEENKTLYVTYTNFDEFIRKIQHDLNLYLSENFGSPRAKVKKRLMQPPTEPIELIGREDTLNEIGNMLNYSR